MLSIKIDDEHKTTIEMSGTEQHILDDALNIVGHLFKTLERQSPPVAHAFIVGIPKIIRVYSENRDYKLFDVADAKIIVNDHPKEEGETK